MSTSNSISSKRLISLDSYSSLSVPIVTNVDQNAINDILSHDKAELSNENDIAPRVSNTSINSKILNQDINVPTHRRLKDSLSKYVSTIATSKTNNPPYSSQSSFNDISASLGIKLGKFKAQPKRSNTGIGRDYWLEDSTAIKCRSCDKKFSTFIRKHHCRICGKIFCSNCTTFIDGSKFNYSGQMRVCQMCNDLAEKYHDDMFSSEDEDEEEAEDEHTLLYNSKSENIIDKLNKNDGFDGLADYQYHDALQNKMNFSSQNNEFYTSNNSQEQLVNGENDLNNDNLFNEETKTISFMNNHEFSWPNSSESLPSNINDYTKNKMESTPRRPSFLSSKDSFKLMTSSSINPSLANIKSSRRRNISGRYRSRNISKNFSHKTVSKNGSFATVPPFSDGFQKVSEKYATALLKELLTDKKISNIEKWTEILINSLKSLNMIEIDLKNISNNSNLNESNYNFTSFIKVKKIKGSQMDKTKVIDGIVFSKKLPIKTMPAEIHNPKIMLISFPIEYDQRKDNTHHFQSLEPIIAQQDEYIKKLVDRIMNLNPTIIVSSESINGLALKLFAERNVTVIPSCKITNLIKLSKFTDSTVFTSIDVLAMKPSLGTCGVFKVLNFRHEDMFNTYVMFDKCPNKIGMTILLRDQNEDILSKVKSCLTIMIYTFINMKLEGSFMRDQCLKIDDTAEFDSISSLDFFSLYSYNLKNYSSFIDLVNTRLVSTTPWVKYAAPLVLLELENIKTKLEKNEISYERFESLTSEEKLKLQNEFVGENFNITNVAELNRLAKETRDYKKDYWNVEMSFYLKKWEQFWRSRELTYFDPNYNQNIVVLFSMISQKNCTPCIEPEIQLIDFYWQNDFSLGQFIEYVCLSAETICSENCQLPMRDHYRSYVHDNGKVEIYVELDESNIIHNNIMTWSVCQFCKEQTPILQLNDTSYKYSFGKFLELIFWFNNAHELKILNNNNICQCKSNHESFDFFKDYTHYFSFRNYKVRFVYNRIDNLKLIIPKFKLLWNPKYDFKIKLDNFLDIKKKSEDFFVSVSNRVRRIKLDGTELAAEEIELGNSKLEKLQEKLVEQKKEIELLLETMYAQSEIKDHLKLNIVLREVQELSSFWNAEFEDFSKKFLPSEKDIKKITAFQLDKLFKSLAGKFDEENDDATEDEEIDDDCENNEEEREGENEILAEADINNSTKEFENASAMESLPATKNSGNYHAKSDDDENQLNKVKIKKNYGDLDKNTWIGDVQDGKSTSRHHSKGRLILNRIHELSGQQGGDLLSIAQSKTTNGPLDEGKVKELTKFFDTQEYFNQRELDKQKMKRFNKYTPKVNTMKPKIEIYKNAREAVNSEASKSLLKGYKESADNSGNDQIAIDLIAKSGGKDGEIEIHEIAGPNNENQTDQQVSKEEKFDKDKELEIEKEKEKEAERQKEKKKTKEIPTEKVSLLKSLTHFWADRSATLWEPLAYPLSSNEHIFVDSDVIVREDEPSSIIAFCLSTKDYEFKLGNSTNAQTENGGKEGESNETDEEIKIDPEVEKTENKTEQDDVELENTMLKKGFHLKYQFDDGYSTILCKIFFTQQFDALRKKCGINENFIESLSRCIKWDSSGGKSGSAFLKTLDQRFIIKELSKAELEAFVHFAPSYFEYFAHVLFHDLPSVLVKIFGFYQIQVKNSLPNSKSYTMDILIMENLFYDRKIDRIFDLKGSMRNRHVEQTGKENEVLLDENMVEYIYESPLFIKENDKRLLRASLWNDTLFLEKMNVMDYSLVVGIDHARDELIVGIIDCIRTFTWDKKLESWVKEKGLVGNSGVGKEPTVITPKQYKNRFREAMERYILMSPGVYYQGTTNFNNSR